MPRPKGSKNKSKNGKAPSPVEEAMDALDTPEERETRGGQNSGYSAEQAKALFADYEDIQDQIDEVMEAARAKCSPFRQHQKEIQDRGDEVGIPRGAFNAKVRERRYYRKGDRVRDKLSSEVQDAFDSLSHALGDLVDTPLGQAAMQAATKPPVAPVKPSERPKPKFIPPTKKVVKEEPEEHQDGDADPYDLGKRAAGDGHTKNMNPYVPGTEKHQEWLAGHAIGRNM